MLIEHLEGWDEKQTIARGPGMWKRIKIASVMFESRKLPLTREQTRESYSVLGKLTEKQVDKYMAEWLKTCDRPETRGSFTVSFKGDWPDEHERRARVRDGAVVEFLVEG